MKMAIPKMPFLPGAENGYVVASQVLVAKRMPLDFSLYPVPI